MIREVSFGERGHHMHSQYLLPKICVLSREGPLREGPLYRENTIQCQLPRYDTYKTASIQPTL